MDGGEFFRPRSDPAAALFRKAVTWIGILTFFRSPALAIQEEP
jgi:hypothetical protein